jgi:hypothetical protein
MSDEAPALAMALRSAYLAMHRPADTYFARCAGSFVPHASRSWLRWCRLTSPGTLEFCWNY